MVDLISQGCVRKVSFMVIPNSIDQFLAPKITWAVHKISEKTTMLCVKHKEELDVAMETVVAAFVLKIESYDLWHNRLCRVSSHSLSRAHQMNIGVPKLLKSFDYEYVCYKFANSTQKQWMSVSGIKAFAPLERVPFDLVGPVRAASMGGSKFFVALHGEYSGYSLVWLTKWKSTVGTFETFVPRQGRKWWEVRVLSRKHCRWKQFYTQNMSAAMPTWSSKIAKAPYETSHGRQPIMSLIRIFGCTAFLHIPK